MSLLSSAQQTQLQQLVSANQSGTALATWGQPLGLQFVGPLIVSIVEQSTLTHWSVIALQTGLLADGCPWQHPLPLWSTRIPRNLAVISGARTRFTAQLLAAQQMAAALQVDVPVKTARAVAVAEVIRSGRAVIGAGFYADLADAIDIAVPAEDLHALETALVAVQALPSDDSSLPEVFEIPLQLADTTCVDAPPIPIRLRVHRGAGTWLLFDTPDGAEHAAVMIERTEGRIELKGWSPETIVDDPAIAGVLVADVTPLLTDGGRHDQHVA